jgi:hypothetical protein
LVEQKSQTISFNIKYLSVNPVRRGKEFCLYFFFLFSFFLPYLWKDLCLYFSFFLSSLWKEFCLFISFFFLIFGKSFAYLFLSFFLSFFLICRKSFMYPFSFFPFFLISGYVCFPLAFALFIFLKHCTS